MYKLFIYLFSLIIIFFIIFSEVNYPNINEINSSIISLSTGSYDYGQRRLHSLCGFVFTITNQGADPLQINSVSFTTQRFRLDTVGITFPVVIQSNLSKDFRIWFNPLLAISYHDSISIFSNASNLPEARIVLTGSGNNYVSTLGDIFWQGVVPDNPYTSYDDYQPISIKQIGDVNGDGVNDIVVSSGNYLTTCFNGNSSVSGDILWVFNTGYNNNNTGAVTWEDGMQIRDDVDGDGVPDVVIGCAGGNEEVYTISGRTGHQIWVYGDSVSYSDGDIEEVRIDKDYNGDGVKDVLVSASGTGSGSGGRHALICLNGLNGNVIFYTTLTADFTADVVATSFGGAIGTAYGSSYPVKGFNNTGGEAWTYTVTGKIWSMKEIPTISTSDTVKEIIGNFGFSGGLFCVAENNGASNWSLSLGSSNNGRIQLLDDLDSNGYIDFTLYGPQTVYRIDSKTSNFLWTKPLGSSYLRGIDFLSDVNGDGKRDLVVSTQQPGQVLILDGTNGNILFTYLWGANIAQRGDRCAVLNSIDGNASTEFIGGCRDGRIVCFSGGQNTLVNVIPVSNEIPDKFSLNQNYPNPFNPFTKIHFDVPVSKEGLTSTVILKIFDITGREIKTLVNGNLKPGFYEVTFDGSNFASGVYFYTLISSNFTETKKMLLIK